MITHSRALRGSVWLFLLQLSVLADATHAWASAALQQPQQQTGTVRGKVVSTNGRPLPGAQVSLPGTGRGGLANSAGDFIIDRVPVGQHTVRAQMIGYGSVDRAVVIATTRVASVTLELSEQAVALDEIIVTGTAGGTQRRALGNVVDRISAVSAIQVTPTTNINQLIAARSPGVQVMGGSGTVGGGAPIHIRGVSSMTLDATPLIYIDGVRMDARLTGPSQQGGARQSRLDDINLDDVESIEIIKGPAAATLYGTEASNGVIQIVTKRGADGPARFDISTRMGTNWLWNPAARTGFSYTGGYVNGAPLDSVNLYNHECQVGPNGCPFKYGSLGNLDLSVRGGTDKVRY
jgi:TonB-dependent starch-binding outer membrane protein SusC